MALPPTHKYWVKPAPCLDPDAAEVQRFQSEVAMYERLGLHPRIVRYHGRHHTPPGILLDFHQNGDLSNYLHHTTARYLSSPAFNGLLILQKVLLTFIPKVQCHHHMPHIVCLTIPFYKALYGSTPNFQTCSLQTICASY